MKGFFKFVLGLAATLAAVVGALAVFDKHFNGNRIKGKYFDCSNDDVIDDIEDDE